MPGHTATEILAARSELARRDPALARADQATPPFAWRVKDSGFAGLVSLIVEQQVSTASAAAIWARLRTGIGEITPDSILALDEPRLKTLGLSGQKARYVREAAEAIRTNTLNLDSLSSRTDDEAIAELIAIKGIGFWTAEAYLMGCEGRTDIFPAGDLALQEALRLADGAPDRPTAKALYLRAETWRPYRGVAAHLLWGYYAARKPERPRRFQRVREGEGSALDPPGSATPDLLRIRHS